MGFPSLGSWVTYGLGSESENLPAYVVMTQPEGTPEGGAPCWGAGFSAGPLPGDAVPERAGADRQPQAARRVLARRAARDARPAALDERAGSRPVRHRALGADRELRAGVPHAECGARGRRSVTRARDDQADCTAWTTRGPSSSARAACWPARLVERGVRFVQLYSGGGPVADPVGRPRQHRRQPREDVRHDRQARRRPAHRPQADGPARRDAGRLGRRVRPHARPPGRRTGPRSQRDRASRCGWPAAASRGARSSARPTRPA